MLSKFVRILISPANFGGLFVAMVGLVLAATRLLPVQALHLALAGYVLGFVGVGVLMGFPHWSRRRGTDLSHLEFSHEGETGEVVRRAVRHARAAIEINPEGRLPLAVRTRGLELCSALEKLLAQWELNRGTLGLGEAFPARDIAVTELPDALRSGFAGTEVAGAELSTRLADLEERVHQLSADLSRRDAEAFRAHAQELQGRGAGDPAGEAVPEMPSAMR